MPTGYTKFIEDGNITTGKDFLKLCLRDFGVMYNYRDVSLTEEVVIDWDKEIVNATSFYKKMLNDAKKEYAEFESKSLQEYRNNLLETYTNRIKEYERFIVEYNKTNEKYDKVLKEIEQWDCPEEFDNIKKFAINQIEISKENTEYYEDAIKRCKIYIDNIDVDSEEEYKNYLAGLNNNVKRYEKDIEEAIKNVNEKKRFYEKFMNEIEKL